MTISNSQSQLIRSLHQKKFRQLHGLFLAEGPKVVFEFLEAGFIPELLIGTSDGLLPFSAPNSFEVSSAVLQKHSCLETSNQILAVFRVSEPTEQGNFKGIHLFLSSIRDPGNLGTILRLADWYGLPQVYLSPDCVEVYNPKVVQASMGSLARIRPVVVEFETLQEKYSALPLYAADMHGSNYHEQELTEYCLLVMGSESHGIPDTIKSQAQLIAIPRFGKAESLNVAIATALFLDKLKHCMNH